MLNLILDESIKNTDVTTTSFSIISVLIIVLLSYKRNIKHFSILYSLI